MDVGEKCGLGELDALGEMGASERTGERDVCWVGWKKDGGRESSSREVDGRDVG